MFTNVNTDVNILINTTNNSARKHRTNNTNELNTDVNMLINTNGLNN